MWLGRSFLNWSWVVMARIYLPATDGATTMSPWFLSRCCCAASLFAATGEKPSHTHTSAKRIKTWTNATLLDRWLSCAEHAAAVSFLFCLTGSLSHPPTHPQPQQGYQAPTLAWRLFTPPRSRAENNKTNPR